MLHSIVFSMPVIMKGLCVDFFVQGELTALGFAHCSCLFLDPLPHLQYSFFS